MHSKAIQLAHSWLAHSCLPFVIAPAPTLFQRTMDAILQEIPNVLCYLHDIIITVLTSFKLRRSAQEITVS